RATVDAIGALDLLDAQFEMLVPLRPPALAGQRVLGVAAPRQDRLLALPVRHGDAEPGSVAGRLEAEVARLLRRQFRHPHRGGAVTIVAAGAARAEDHRVV